MKVLLVVTAAMASNVGAACPSDRDTAAMAARSANLELVPNRPTDLTMADAICGRDKFTRFVGQNLGKVAGFKAGLTNPTIRLMRERR